MYYPTNYNQVPGDDPSFESTNSSRMYGRRGSSSTAPLLAGVSFLAILAAIGMSIAALVIATQSSSSSSTSNSSETPASTPLTWTLVDGTGASVSSQTFSSQVRFIHTYDGFALLDLPMTNFQLPASLTSGAFLQTSTDSPIPEAFRPPHGVDPVSLHVSSTEITFLPLSGADFPFPPGSDRLPVVAYNLTIYSSGQLRLALHDGTQIPPGPHTLNAQALVYTSRTTSPRDSAPTLVQILSVPLQLEDAMGWPVDPAAPATAQVTLSMTPHMIQLVFQNDIQFTTYSTMTICHPYGTIFNDTCFCSWFDTACPFSYVNDGGFVASTQPLLPPTLCPGTAQVQVQVKAADSSVPDLYDLGINIAIDVNCRLLLSASNVYAGTLPIGAYTIKAPTIRYLLVSTPSTPGQEFVIQTELMNVWDPTSAHIKADGFGTIDVDFYNGQMMTTWVSNANHADIANNVFNVFVGITTVHDTSNAPSTTVVTQVTHYTTTNTFFPLEQGGVISRTNPTHLTATWTQDSGPFSPSDGNRLLTNRTRCFTSSTSSDGGATWTTPSKIGPYCNVLGFVPAAPLEIDKFNTIWWLIHTAVDPISGTTLSHLGTVAGSIQLVYSRDDGHTWATDLTNLVYDLTTTPSLSDIGGWNYCSTFGFGPGGQYGLYVTAGVETNSGYDYLTYLGFVPISGATSFGTLTMIPLTNQLGQVPGIATIKSLKDGSLYMMGWWQWWYGVNNGPQLLFTKQPGTLSDALILPPQTVFTTGGSITVQTPFSATTHSGYTLTQIAAQDIQVHEDIANPANNWIMLTFMTAADPRSPDMMLWTIFSFDGGKTFSQRVSLSSSSVNNRGGFAVATDPMTGAVAFAWFDGRADPFQHGLQLYGRVWKSSEVTSLVSTLAPAAA